MKEICPNNLEHKRFVTVAYVSEDWVCDEEGNFLEGVYMYKVYKRSLEAVLPE